MLYDAEKGDKGIVTIDGDIIGYVIRCDDEQGWVEFATQPFQVSDNSDSIVTAFRYGKVEVKAL